MNRATLCKATFGFTLVEMAVVLVIVGLMLGGLLVPLSTQMETDRRKETASTLDSIREALIGFAIINNRFPCPDANNDGIANDACITTSYSVFNPPGRLPFATLGVSATDAWNRPWTYMVNGGFTTGTFSLGSAGSGLGQIRISSVAGCGSLMLANDVAALVISEGKNDITTSVLEQENDPTNSCFVDAGYVQGANGFDDQLAWIARGTLFNRMVAAGKPPAP